MMSSLYELVGTGCIAKLASALCVYPLLCRTENTRSLCIFHDGFMKPEQSGSNLVPGFEAPVFELKKGEIQRVNMTPRPVEFELYYSV
jgi:hypothetical protein